jgi:3'-phosphoadenosine 5'-phosphosulfate sulfotransferase (PAPS reductase)/FAD synthetase
MPRNNIDPQRLSDAWKELYKHEKVQLKKKIIYSEKLIIKALKNSKNPTISWSGGKDSTVILHLILRHAPKIPVIFIDLDCLFPESKKYVLELTKLWKINLIITKSNTHNFQSITHKYGFPIFSKNIASNVERAVRTGNIRSQLSSLEKFLTKHKAKISSKCSQFLLENPCKLKEKELKCDLKFIGLRALESRARVRLWADYGDMYAVKDYYGKNKPITKCTPISLWSDKNIWEYFDLHKIPICDIYKKGYERNGCWTCAMAIRHGQLKRLKDYNGKLYDKLMEKSEMGKEIKRLKRILDNTSEYKNYINLPD